MTYELTVDIAIPMLGLMKRKAEKIIIDTALKELKKRVESLWASPSGSTSEGPRSLEAWSTRPAPSSRGPAATPRPPILARSCTASSPSSRSCATAEEIAAVGIGSAGFVDAARSTVLFAPNLAWRNVAVRAQVFAATDLPVVVENDANAAAWGEFRFGVAEDVDDMVCVTVGTGIGGGLVLDGAVYRGAHGVGAELGHMRVVPNGHLCGCGNRGCLEQYASGQALVREARGDRVGGLGVRGQAARAGRRRPGEDHRPDGDRGGARR